MFICSSAPLINVKIFSKAFAESASRCRLNASTATTHLNIEHSEQVQSSAARCGGGTTGKGILRHSYNTMAFNRAIKLYDAPADSLYESQQWTLQLRFWSGQKVFSAVLTLFVVILLNETLAFSWKGRKGLLDGRSLRLLLMCSREELIPFTLILHSIDI